MPTRIQRREFGETDVVQRVLTDKGTFEVDARVQYVVRATATNFPQGRVASSMRRSSRQPRGGQATTAESLPPHGAPHFDPDAFSRFIPPFKLHG
jgi:hypothetical protein